MRLHEVGRFPGILRSRADVAIVSAPCDHFARAYDDVVARCVSCCTAEGEVMPLAKAEPGKSRVGWIGTGVMGRWMCQHLLDKGYQATVHNRSRDKAKPLLDAGAAWADSPRAVAERSDFVFAIVGFPADVREVFLGQQGALAGSRASTVLVDMTTSEPSLAREIHQAAAGKGVQTLDAPVSGGDVGARNAALSIMVGGDEEAVVAARPLLE